MKKIIIIACLLAGNLSSATSWPPPPLRTKYLPSILIPQPKNKTDFIHFYQSLLDGNPGLFFGEYHGQTLDHFKKFMPIFSHLGVKMLFVEQMRSAQQKVIDLYNRGLAGKKEILEVITTAGFEPESHFAVFAAAHAVGIQIYGLDIAPPESGIERLRYTNPHWFSVIKKTIRQLAPGEKYLAIAGRAHTGFPPLTEIVGVDVALGIPSVDFGRDHVTSIYKCSDGEADYVLDLRGSAKDVATDRFLGIKNGCG